MFNLFMNYANQYQIKQAGIYRYRFQTKEISCFEVYQLLVKTFIQKPHDSSFFNYDLRFLEAILLIRTTDDVYYCNIFFNEAQPNRIFMFEKILKSHAIEYKVYIENQSNTQIYQRAWDVEWLGYLMEKDDLPCYSYWHWLNDITSSEINNYILLQLPPHDYEYGKINVYFKCQDVIDLINFDNFYYLYFDHCSIPEDAALFIKTLEEGKKLTLEKQLEDYRQVLNPIKYDYFKEFLTYKPHAESEMPIIYVGIIDATLRQNFRILYININLENTCITELYNLFDVEFAKLIEAVVMFKPRGQKEHTIFFMLDYNANYNELQKLLTNLNINTKLKSIEDFNYNYCDSIYDYNRVYIEINSLVVGLYTKDANYWSTFYDTLNNDLYLTDAMMSALYNIPPNNAYFKSVEDIEFVTKFDGYVAFMQYKKK